MGPKSADWKTILVTLDEAGRPMGYYLDYLDPLTVKAERERVLQAAVSLRRRLIPTLRQQAHL